MNIRITIKIFTILGLVFIIRNASIIFKSTFYSHFQKDSQKNALYLEDRIVNIPSSVIPDILNYNI